MDEHAKRAPSPPVGTQATAPSSTPDVVESGQSEAGQQQLPGDVLVVDQREEMGSDTTPADEKKTGASHPGGRRHYESTSPAVDDLVEDCDIPETILEGPEEEDDNDDIGNVARDNGDAQQRPPVLFQPLLMGDDARARTEGGLQNP
jgi:hypothetical protein